MNTRKPCPNFVKSQVLPTVIYCWTIGGIKPDLNQPYWSVDIDSNPYDIYSEYMKQLAGHNPGFTYYQAEKWLSETLIKLGLSK